MSRHSRLLCFALLLCLTGYGASYRPAYAQTVVGTRILGGQFPPARADSAYADIRN